MDNYFQLPNIQRNSHYPLGDVPISVPTCNAWASIVLGSSPTYNGVGISSVTRIGTGKYGVSFDVLSRNQYASGSYSVLFTPDLQEDYVNGSYAVVSKKCSGATVSGVSSGFEFSYFKFDSSGVPALSDISRKIYFSVFSFSTDSVLGSKGLTAQYSIVPGSSGFGVSFSSSSGPFNTEAKGGITGNTLYVSSIIHQGQTIAVGNTLYGSFTSRCSGTIIGSTLNVQTYNFGHIQVGATVFGVGVCLGTVITSLGTGTGKTGTYGVNIGQSLQNNNNLFVIVKGVTGNISSLVSGTTGGVGQYILSGPGQTVTSNKSIIGFISANPIVYYSGLSYSSSLPNYQTKRTAVAYGTIVIPPRYGHGEQKFSCYLENYYNISGVSGTSGSVFDLYFGNDRGLCAMNNTDYCVIAHTEKENITEGTETASTNINKNEFCLVQVRSGLNSQYKTVNNFRIETLRQSPTTPLLGLCGGYFSNNSKKEKIHFMVFGGSNSYDTN